MPPSKFIQIVINRDQRGVTTLEETTPASTSLGSQPPLPTSGQTTADGYSPSSFETRNGENVETVFMQRAPVTQGWKPEFPSGWLCCAQDHRRGDRPELVNLNTSLSCLKCEHKRCSNCMPPLPPPAETGSRGAADSADGKRSNLAKGTVAANDTAEC